MKQQKPIFIPKNKAKVPRYYEKPFEEEQDDNVNKKQSKVICEDSEILKETGYRVPKFRNNVPDEDLNDKNEIPEEVLKKYSRGERVNLSGVKTNHYKEKQERKEKRLNFATEQAARTEILLNEQAGFLEADEGESTTEFRQSEIASNVDILAASKQFKLNLDFGPYVMRYTKNGRHLLLGGRQGHVAGFDWITKKLHFEINVMEEVADITWFHIETMFACAQKDWVYIYDNKGTEIHCVRKMFKVNKMEFLPYHFLLATASSVGYLSWLDVTMGEFVGNVNTKLGDIRLMRSNPANGVLCVSGAGGIVTMWSPKVREPLVKMLCHPTPISALCVDPKGMHLITAGLEKSVRIWDIRKLDGPLGNYVLRCPANQVEVSQNGVLAISMANLCEMYKNVLIKDRKFPYLRHNCEGFVHGMRFCPYEDCLGVATVKGFESLLVPGSGEPNYDAFEDNPYQTKKQRREREVKLLLDKIPPELITLDPKEILFVDEESFADRIEAKKSLFFLKPPQIDFKPRRKMKGKGGSAKAARNKQIVKDIRRKEFIQELRKSKREVIDEHKVVETESNNFIPLEDTSNKQKYSALDRFKPKNKKIKQQPKE